MNPSDRLTFCIKVLNIFEKNSALERCMKKKLKMECLGDKCHVCAFSDAQKASRGLNNRQKIFLFHGKSKILALIFRGCIFY
jgi:hypothetical protein